MPAVVEELFQGRTEVVNTHPEVASLTAEIPYLVRGATDEDEVKSAVLVAAPEDYADMPRESIEISERVNADTWKAVVRYKKSDEPASGEDPPEPVFTFDTGGGMQHITQSLQTISRYGPGASDKLGGAIGFDGERVEGVDITIPVYAFSETHILPASTVTLAYQGALFRATGTVNSGLFRGLAPGEGLFLGASGARRGTAPDDDWEITFKFAAQPNRNDIMVGDIGPIVKRGWDYLWVQYAPDVDDDVHQLIRHPIAAYVEKVYPDGDFSTLGIGI